MIVYLDLDRTLFKTGNVKVLWEYIAQQYPEIGDAFAGRETYYHYVDDMYYYDMSAHLTSLGLEPELVYGELGNSIYADGRFEYEGAGELIEALLSYGYDVRIMTFGTDDYQRFKASLCPSLLGLPIVSTLRPKPEVLEELEEECWLVDDRPLGDELPGNVSFVQVSLEGKPIPPDVFWPVKRSLHETKEFFDAIMH